MRSKTRVGKTTYTETKKKQYLFSSKIQVLEK